MGESGIYSIEIVLYWPEIAKIDGFKAISTNSGLNMSIIFVIWKLFLNFLYITNIIRIV